jgi:hypothetical protein
MPYNQVATFHSNSIPPDEYAQMIVTTAKMYNNATILVEYENLGPQVANQIYSDFEYDNILFTESAGTVGKRVTTKVGKGVDKGVKMTVTVKRTGCSILKLLIEQNQLIINDHTTIEELSTFAKKGNTYQAEPGKHDDLVMGLVVFAWLSDQNFFKELTNINTIASLRERSAQQIQDEMIPFGFVDTGEDRIIDLDEPYKNFLFFDPDDQPANF